MGVDQPQYGAGRTSPAKWSMAEYWQKNKPGLRSPGCRLQFGGAEKRPSARKLQTAKFKHPF
jgi:hypothetical protein